MAKSRADELIDQLDQAEIDNLVRALSRRGYVPRDHTVFQQMREIIPMDRYKYGQLVNVTTRYEAPYGRVHSLNHPHGGFHVAGQVEHRYELEIVFVPSGETYL